MIQSLYQYFLDYWYPSLDINTSKVSSSDPNINNEIYESITINIEDLGDFGNFDYLYNPNGLVNTIGGLVNTSNDSKIAQNDNSELEPELKQLKQIRNRANRIKREYYDKTKCHNKKEYYMNDKLIPKQFHKIIKQPRPGF